MAFVPVTLADVEKWIAGIYVAGPDDGTDAAASTDQGKYNAAEITRAILYADLELCRIIVGSLANGYRVQYIANSADLAYGDAIPFHPGKIGQPEVKIGTAYVPGILAPSLEAISRWKANTSLFPTATCAGRYYITEEHKVYFIGDGIRVSLPADLVKTSACQAPQCYTPTVVRAAASLVPKDGVDLSLVRDLYTEYQRDVEMIRAGETAVPALDLFKRAVG